DWAASEANVRRLALTTARVNADAAATALRAAETELDKASKGETASRQDESVATAAHERAKATLAGLTTRLGELTVALVGAPSEVDAQAELARIDELAAAVDDADAALGRTRTAREQAEESARTLNA